jgi:hypothetical protein
MMRITTLTLCASALLIHGARANTVTAPCVKDNSMFKESGAWSNGYGSGLYCGVNSQDNVRRALVQFDVASVVPAGATITGAVLTMDVAAFESTLATNMELRRVLAPWGEGLSSGAGVYAGAPALAGDATWTHAQYPSIPWAAPGGDCVGTPSASRIIGQTGLYTWDSTPELVADVQMFLDSPASNHGWVLRCSDEVTSFSTKVFSSRHTGPLGPRLIVTYTPFAPTNPFTSFCNGDGGGTPCPCAPGQPNYGCRNSLGYLGARLVAGGNPGASAATDTMTLYTVGLSGPGMFIQGTDVFAGGAGVAFGDGLLCSGGAITRLGIVFPESGYAVYPGGLTPNPVHIAGGPINAGDVRNYQVWYRDAAVYCTEATFNLTQAVSAVWGP